MPRGRRHQLDAHSHGPTQQGRDRVFYTDPAPREPGSRGRPRRHGERFGCADDPNSWPEPDQQLIAEHARYSTVHVQAWHGLHPQLAGRGRWAQHDKPPIVSGTVNRGQVQHLPKPTARATKTLWLWASGPQGILDIDLASRAYLRRFDVEHTYRFVKNTLRWRTRVSTYSRRPGWTRMRSSST